MTKTDIQFQIDQLRKDKIIYAIESAATSLAMFVFYLVAPQIKEVTLWLTFESLHYVVGIISISYWLYMGIGNLFRLKKIKQLEKQLYESQ